MENQLDQCLDVIEKLCTNLHHFHKPDGVTSTQGTANWTYYFKVLENPKNLASLKERAGLVGVDSKPLFELLKKETGPLYQARVHGDLNLTNVLVALGSDRSPQRVFILDFADSRKPWPVALDFTRMETELWQETGAELLKIYSDDVVLGWFEMGRNWLDNLGDLSEDVPVLFRNLIQVTAQIRKQWCRLVPPEDIFVQYHTALCVTHLRGALYQSVRKVTLKTRLAFKGAELSQRCLANSRVSRAVRAVPTFKCPLVIPTTKASYVRDTPESQLREHTKQTLPNKIPDSYKRLFEKLGIQEAIVDSNSANRKLEDLYVPLKTTWAGKEEELAENSGETSDYISLDSLTSHKKNKHFLVVGETGSGKSTFSRYWVSSFLAKGESLPLYLQLKNFAVWLNKSTKRNRPIDGSGLLLRTWAGETFAEFGLDEKVLEKWKGHLIWFLDGLDEIFNDRDRLDAAKIIGKWLLGDGEGDRIFITARPHAAEPNIVNGLRLTGTLVRIAPLDEKGQKQVLSHWFRVVYNKAIWEEELNRLWPLLNNVVSEKFRGNPLQLTTCASIYYSKKGFPDQGSDLYHRMIEILLDRRFGAEAGGDDNLVRKMMSALEGVARGMMKEEVKGELGFNKLLKRHLYPDSNLSWEDSDKLKKIGRNLVTYSGILIKTVQGQYSFSFPAYQHCLAARAFCQEDSPINEMAEHIDKDAWREVFLMTGDYLLRWDDAKTGISYIQGLMDMAKESNEATRLELAMRVCVEAKSDLFESQTREMITWGCELLEAGRGDIHSRIGVGECLGLLDDTRLDMMAKERWVHIEPGEFTMGNEDAYDAQPPHKIEISNGFWMGKYPVTCKEYALFLEDGGYRNSQWWSEEGWRWLSMYEKDANFQNWFKKVKKKFKEAGEDYVRPEYEPRYWRNSLWYGKNLPVVGVNFFEVEAYTKWLTTKLDPIRKG